MLKILFFLVFLFTCPAWAEDRLSLSPNALKLLHENGLPAIMRLSNPQGRTAEIQVTLWGLDPASDRDALKVLRNIHKTLYNRYAFRKDDRDECRWRQETYSARTHCFFTINGIHQGAVKRVIVYGCNAQSVNPFILSVDEYWNPKINEDFWYNFDLAYQGR